MQITDPGYTIPVRILHLQYVLSEYDKTDSLVIGR